MGILEDYAILISFLSLLLAVGALCLAIWQTRMALKQTKLSTIQTENLSKHDESLTTIQQALSTKYLGQFPEYSEAIANLIEKAKRKIVLFYDIPAYGLFSNPDGWLKIKQAIERKVEEELEISVTLYSAEKRRRIMEEQFHHKGDQFNDWVNSPEMKGKVSRFMKRFGGGMETGSLTHESYLELSERAQNNVLNDTFAGVKVEEAEELIPIYFWMIDDKEAIISIPTFTKDTTEYGFYTSDKSFVSALMEMKGRYVK